MQTFSAFNYGSRKFYRRTGEFRTPRKGEFYLSGAVIEVHRAPADLPSKYWIVEEVEAPPLKIRMHGVEYVRNDSFEHSKLERLS